MFEQYILASNLIRITKRFNITSPIDSSLYTPSFKIIPGNNSNIIRSNQVKKLEQASFGLKSLSSKLHEGVSFVRSEGKRNLSDDPNYTGSKAIFLEPEFKSLIRSQRCLVIADGFILKSNNKAYLIYLRNKKRPFAFAGIWNKSKDDELTFAILTTTSNSLVEKLGHKRMPVILHMEQEHPWLRKSTELSEVLGALNPYPHFLMNAYPVDAKLLNSGENDISIIQPIGSPILHEPKGNLNKKRKKVIKNVSNNPTLGDLAGYKT